MLFTPVTEPSGDTARDTLLTVLIDALGDRSDGPAASVEAGRRWGRQLERSGSDRTVVTDLMERLGFEPEADGDAVRLRSCPFRDAARAHPEIVCAVHRGLLEQVVQNRDGGSEAGIRLSPFVEPELCLVSFSE